MRTIASWGAALGVFLAIAGGINLFVAYLLFQVIHNYDAYASLTMLTGAGVGVTGVLAALYVWEVLDDFRHPRPRWRTSPVNFTILDSRKERDSER